MGDNFKDFKRQIRRVLRERDDIDAPTVLLRLGHMACSLAMSGAEEYLRAARLQMRRIDAAAKPGSRGRDGARMFREIHFYMICWDAIWKILKMWSAVSNSGKSRLTVQPEIVRLERWR